jgi:CheY-like chemotaxis protein
MMSGQKVLAIDDSVTIRRLVDTYLSPAGYQVILAGTAEEGLKLAEETQPDVILLDHQLPGTTGYEVCRQLAERPDTRQTPVVISSTLRNRAYVEYADMPNVVDMLPKPYTVDLLQTTIANALDTGALVVESQEQGTAVPEVIEEMAEPELSGTFSHFQLREVLDFLNNTGKRGILQIEGEYRRTLFHLGKGRILGVTASGVDADDLVRRLPSSLHSLAPVLRLTVSGQTSGQMNGIVELLDRKVLDPRLLRKLLRHQAAILTYDCFTQDLKEFRFQSLDTSPLLQGKLPLEVSLLALLMEGAVLCDMPELPSGSDQAVFVRRMFRGQNLDRAGVPAQQMKLLSLLGKPQSMADLVRELKWDQEEVQRMLFALMLADFVEMKSKTRTRHVVVYEANAAAAQRLREFHEGNAERYRIRVVKDRLALQMVLKREQPNVLVFSLDDDDAAQLYRELRQSEQESLADAKWIGIVPPASESDEQPKSCAEWSERMNAKLDATVVRPYRPDDLLTTLDGLVGVEETPGLSEDSAPAGSDADDQSRSFQHGDGLCAVEA